jgi:phage shock protein C
MFCTKCGAQLKDSARFCSTCGTPTAPGAFAHPLPEFAAPAYEGRRLRRIESQKKIAGVCAGYAEYFGMDVTLMRLIWVALLLLPPSIGLIAYIVSWIVLPKE